MRHCLDVRQSTPLLALYSELGRIPLHYIIALRMFRFWLRLLSLPPERLAKHSYLDQLRLYNINPSFNPWCSFIANTLQAVGLHDVWITQVIPNGNKNFYNLIRSKIFELFSDRWHSETVNYTSLDNYRLFKQNINLEKYLSIIRNEKHRKAFTRLRLHSHNLAIESGRHSSPKIPRELRLCVYCNSNQIEDEIHFLICCPLYDNLRATLLDFIHDKSPEDAFIYLMHSTIPHILRKTA